MKKSIFILLVLAMIGSMSQAQNSPLSKGYRKALFIGAHPDDNESCAGGTMILLRQQGCQVVSVYFTSGERGIPGISLDEAATIRRKELAEACQVMGVRYRLMTQIDGAAEVNAERYKEMLQVIEEEQPDVVFTHWPIDSHLEAVRQDLRPLLLRGGNGHAVQKFHPRRVREHHVGRGAKTPSRSLP